MPVRACEGVNRLMSIDFTKAFLYGEMEREVYIELPNEDGRKQGGSNVGLLRQAMYGLRDSVDLAEAGAENAWVARI